MYRDIKINETSKFFEDCPFPLVSDDIGVYRICLPLKKYAEASYIKVTAMRADGITVTDGAYINGDTAYYVMAKNMYAVSGKLDLRISLLNTDNKALTTKMMTFDVLEAWENGIDGEDRYPIIYEALMAAYTAQQTADKNKSSIENEIEIRKEADTELSTRLDYVEADDFVTTNRIKNKAVTEDKLSDEVKDSINNNATGLTLHTTDKSNPHGVTKSQVGLGNVDNTADIDKPISAAVQEALNLKEDKTEVVKITNYGYLAYKGYVNGIVTWMFPWYPIDKTVWYEFDTNKFSEIEGEACESFYDYQNDCYYNVLTEDNQEYIPICGLVYIRFTDENGVKTAHVRKSHPVANHKHTIEHILELQTALDLKADKSEVNELIHENFDTLSTAVGEIPKYQGEITTVNMTSYNLDSDSSTSMSTLNITCDVSLEEVEDKFYIFVDQCGVIDEVSASAGVVFQYCKFNNSVDIFNGETNGASIESTLNDITTNAALHWNGAEWEKVSTNEIGLPIVDRVVKLEDRVSALEEGGGGSMQDITITENGIYTPDYPNKGFGVVTVNTEDQWLKRAERLDYMFYSKTDIDFTRFNIYNAWSMSYMFYNCVNLKDMTIDGTAISIGNYAFHKCPKLTNVTFNCEVNDNSIPSTASGISANVDNMFGYSSADVDCLNVHFKGKPYMKYMFEYCYAPKIKITTDYSGDEPCSCSSAFASCLYVTEINLSGIKISTADSMFRSCNKLTTINIDTADCIYMSQMFAYCQSLKTITLSSVKSMTGTNSSTSLTGIIDRYCTAIENFTIAEENTTVASINLSYATKLTVESMLSIFNSLKPRDTMQTSSSAYQGVVNLGATNLAKLTDEQKNIALNKNWMLI